MSKSIKKSCTITTTELELLEIIKDKALNKKLVLDDSKIIRLGIYLVSQLSEDKLLKTNKELTLPKSNKSK